MGDGGGRHWLVRMEWRTAGWSLCLPLLIFPCAIKSRSSLVAPAHPVGPGKRAVKRLCVCVCVCTCVEGLTEEAGEPCGLLQAGEARADGLTDTAVLVASVEEDGSSERGTDTAAAATGRQHRQHVKHRLPARGHHATTEPHRTYHQQPHSYTQLVMAALRSRCGHYIFCPVVSFYLLSSSFFYSSPNLSGRRLDVYRTSTHAVAQVRI